MHCGNYASIISQRNKTFCDKKEFELRYNSGWGNQESFVIKKKCELYKQKSWLWQLGKLPVA